jgi:hypothetical protein
MGLDSAKTWRKGVNDISVTLGGTFREARGAGRPLTVVRSFVTGDGKPTASNRSSAKAHLPNLGSNCSSVAGGIHQGQGLRRTSLYSLISWSEPSQAGRFGGY